MTTATVAAVLELFQRPGCGRRSKPFVQGMKTKLEFLLEKKPMEAIYPEGSVEFDAFHAGASAASDHLVHWIHTEGGGL